jgi:polyphosphate glucokinase
MTGPRTLAIDIGGTGLKMIVLDPQGSPLTERTRIDTPRPATPDALLAALTLMAASHGDFERTSVGFPGVVRRGVVYTAPNLDEGWSGFALAQALQDALGRPARVANDADVQGLGVIQGQGVELVITLGTGVGAGLFVDGRLVPNLELGHHPFKGSKTYEQRLGKAAQEARGKKKWGRDLLEAIDLLSRIFNFDTLYIGGGNAKKVEKMELPLPENVRLVDNVAGLLGGIKLWETPTGA